MGELFAVPAEILAITEGKVSDSDVLVTGSGRSGVSSGKRTGGGVLARILGLTIWAGDALSFGMGFDAVDVELATEIVDEAVELSVEAVELVAICIAVIFLSS